MHISADDDHPAGGMYRIGTKVNTQLGENRVGYGDFDEEYLVEGIRPEKKPDVATKDLIKPVAETDVIGTAAELYKQLKEYGFKPKDITNRINYLDRLAAVGIHKTGDAHPSLALSDDVYLFGRDMLGHMRVQKKANDIAEEMVNRRPTRTVSDVIMKTLKRRQPVETVSKRLVDGI
jgi:hypothetical protein